MARVANPSNPLFDEICGWLNLNPNHVDAISMHLDRDHAPTVSVTAALPRENSAAYTLRKFHVTVREVAEY